MFFLPLKLRGNQRQSLMKLVMWLRKYSILPDINLEVDGDNIQELCEQEEPDYFDSVQFEDRMTLRDDQKASIQ